MEMAAPTTNRRRGIFVRVWGERDKECGGASYPENLYSMDMKWHLATCVNYLLYFSGLKALEIIKYQGSLDSVSC